MSCVSIKIHTRQWYCTVCTNFSYYCPTTGVLQIFLGDITVLHIIAYVVGPLTAGLVIQPFQTVAEDVFISQVGPSQRSVNPAVFNYTFYLLIYVLTFVGRVNKKDGVGDAAYSLVGQTSFRPTELRFHQINLTIDQFIAIEPGDVLGLYAPEYNPLPWTSVPCAEARQRPLVSPDTTGRRPVAVGRRRAFVAAPPATDGSPVFSCRQYSFSALLGTFCPAVSAEPKRESDNHQP